ncbi:N-acetylneuraminate synthase family protein [bacterium]|nr:N-acetylneuraminate synthase family protein [bacterium]
MEWATEILIDGRRISNDSPTYFIADIAANHDGDLERAKDLIYQAAEVGADAAKFQHFQAKTIVSDHGFRSLGAQLSHQSLWEKSVFEIYRDASLDCSWTPVLKETCKRAGIHFFTSPYDGDFIDDLDPFIPAYKIGSGDITFLQIVEQMALKKKPLLLATGASGLTDVNRAVSIILRHNKQLILMQCNTNYTASSNNFHYINLNVLKTYAEKYPGMILGLSDHTLGHTTVLGAIALGARVIEKHFTDDNSRTGPDHKFSMTPKTWRDMVDCSRELESAMGDGVKRVEENEKETVVVQRRCLRLVRSLPAGAVIQARDLEALRPAPHNSLEPYRLAEVTGSTVARPKSQGDALLVSDIRKG